MATSENFTDEELRCSHCGENKMHPDFLERLERIRKVFGKPMPITSGYRCPKHPIEARKARPTSGAHPSGRAVDVGVRGRDAYRLVKVAMMEGIPRIGIKQHKGGRFIHLDDAPHLPQPTVWSYS
jgi:uncharacterized protein YcbK (DUF882 family)